MPLSVEQGPNCNSARSLQQPIPQWTFLCCSFLFQPAFWNSHILPCGGSLFFPAVLRTSDAYDPHRVWRDYFFLSAGRIFFRARSTLITPIAALSLGTVIALVGSAALLLCATIWPHDAWLGVLALCLLLGGAGIIVPAGKAATMGQVDSAFGSAASTMKFVQSACALMVSACAAVLFSAQNILPLLLLYLAVTLLACLGAALLRRSSLAD